jgi:Ca2+-binding EF-hand superfamily protein
MVLVSSDIVLSRGDDVPNATTSEVASSSDISLPDAVPSPNGASSNTKSSDTGDVQELLLLGPTYPLRINLHIDVSGIKFHDVWQRVVDESFDRFDTEKKGHISVEQANRLIALFSSGGGQPRIAPPSLATMMKMSKGYSREEATAQLAKIAPPFTVRHHLASRGAGPALFSLLDTDGDGRLSRAELNAAEQSLRGRDFNDDGLITAEELISGPGRGAESRGGQGTSLAVDGPVIAISPATSTEALAETLLFRYDQNHDGQLSLSGATPELRAPANMFAKFDLNHDQMLDRSELTAMLQSSVDMEMFFSLGRSTGQRHRSNDNAQAATIGYRLRIKLDGGYRLTVAEIEIDFRRNNRDPAQANQSPNFSNYDQNKDGFLSKDELSTAGMANNLPLMDTNSDGKVSPEEFEAFFHWQSEIAGAQLVLEATDEGQDLFTLLDRNGDGVLSPRELKSAADILATDDSDHDGFITSADIPYHVMLELSRGGASAAANPLVSLGSPARQPRRTKPTVSPPDWFTKMDRNGDGEISPSEFLGSREQFDALDTNRDGLIDAAEAAAADAKRPH